MKGGQFTGGREHGGAEAPAAAAMTGGRRRRRSSKRRGSKRRAGSKRRHKGGEGIIATAAVPFGLLALQRFFKGSKTSKRDVREIGSSFKRTFRRRR
jgi:hypothetical protein